MPFTLGFTLGNLGEGSTGSASSTSPYSITWNSKSIADGSHTIAAVANDAALNYATSSITVTVDNTAPVRSAGSPSGTLAVNTTSTTLSLTSDEAATCKYSTTSGTAYGSMTVFATTRSTSHSTSVSGLTNGGSYVYYVKCQDGAAASSAGRFSNGWEADLLNCVIGSTYSWS